MNVVFGQSADTESKVAAKSVFSFNFNATTNENTTIIDGFEAVLWAAFVCFIVFHYVTMVLMVDTIPPLLSKSNNCFFRFRNCNMPERKQEFRGGSVEGQCNQSQTRARSTCFVALK